MNSTGIDPQFAQPPFLRTRFVAVCLHACAMLSACGGGSGSSGDGNYSPFTAQGSGVINLVWDGSTSKVDGTCATDIVAYKLNMGLESGDYRWSDIVPISEGICEPSPYLTPCGSVPRCSVTYENVASASWYITIQAIDSYDNISAHSNEIVRTP